jgi:hypothetical protein
MSAAAKRRDELEAQLAEIKRSRDDGEEKQSLEDLEAEVALTIEHGTVAGVKVARFVPGHPVRAFVRTPTSPEYKRYKDLIFRAANEKKGAAMSGKAAQEQLARACWVYPASDEAKDAMLEAFPGLLTPISQAATSLAEGQTEDTGKD